MESFDSPVTVEMTVVEKVAAAIHEVNTAPDAIEDSYTEFLRKAAIAAIKAYSEAIGGVPRS